MKKLFVVLVVLVVLGALSMATGMLKLSVGRDSPNKPSQTEASWRTYQNKDFGYVISYPAEWILRENTGSSREILLTQPANLGFVRIAGMLDPNVNSEAAIRASLKDYQDSFVGKKGETLVAFKSDVQGQVAGFMAAGSMQLNGMKYSFKERGLLSTKGRVLIMRGAVQPGEQKVLEPVVTRIMNSFQAAQ